MNYYAAMLRRRWMPVVMVPMLVGIVVMVQIFVAEPAYTTSAQFTVTRAPQQVDIEEFQYNEYYLFLASEFLVDDLVEVVQGNVFAEDVHQRILDDYGVTIPPEQVQAAISSERTHRILEIDVARDDEDTAVMIAQAAAWQLNENATAYFGFDGDERGALVEPVQFPGSASPDTGRSQVFWALQLMVAVFGGLLIGIFLEYIDDRLYTTEMVEHSLGLDVLGEVPRGKVT